MWERNFYRPIRSTCLAKAVISAGLDTLLPQINLCDPKKKPMLSAQLLKTFPLRQPCDETSPVTSSLCLMSTLDALLEVMGQRYREVYNQQAEKQMSEQSDGPALRVCWDEWGNHRTKFNQQGNCTSDGRHNITILSYWEECKESEREPVWGQAPFHLMADHSLTDPAQSARLMSGL